MVKMRGKWIAVQFERDSYQRMPSAAAKSRWSAAGFSRCAWTGKPWRLIGSELSTFAASLERHPDTDLFQTHHYRRTLFLPDRRTLFLPAPDESLLTLLRAYEFIPALNDTKCQF